MLKTILSRNALLLVYAHRKEPGLRLPALFRFSKNTNPAMYR
jgi:hypothetical protein